jgi:threonine-phosphate decarboxylase
VSSAKQLIATRQVAVLRSMTKDAALAGVRIGALLAAPAIVDVVRRMTPPWSVSSLAQAAGIAACQDLDHLERARVAVDRSRTHLTTGLRALGLAPWPSVANFVTVPVGDGRAVAAALLDLGCAVRDCASFGLPACIRIGVRSVEDQDRLLDALRVVLTREGSPAHGVESALPEKLELEPEPWPAAWQPDGAGPEPRPGQP